MYFGTKQAAKTYAAQEACRWLESHGFMSSSSNGGGGHLPTPMINNVAAAAAAAGTTAAVRVEGQTIQLSRQATTAAKVHQLCHILNLPTAEYRFRTTVGGASSFVDGGVYLPITSGDHNQAIVEVRGVLGKKKAREECARGLLEVLIKKAEERDGVRVLEID